MIRLRAPDDMTDAVKAHSDWAQAVMEELEVKDQKKDEIFYCHQARLCAIKGDPEGALQAAIECSEKKGAAVRLRTYVPALAAYASKGPIHAFRLRPILQL